MMSEQKKSSKRYERWQRKSDSKRRTGSSRTWTSVEPNVSTSNYGHLNRCSTSLTSRKSSSRRPSTLVPTLSPRCNHRTTEMRRLSRLLASPSRPWLKNSPTLHPKITHRLRRRTKDATRKAWSGWWTIERTFLSHSYRLVTNSRLSKDNNKIATMSKRTKT